MRSSSPSLISLERPTERPTLLDEQDEELPPVSQGSSLVFGAAPLVPPKRPFTPYEISDSESDSPLPSPPTAGEGRALVLQANFRPNGNSNSQNLAARTKPGAARATSTPDSFLIHLSGGATHVWRAPGTPEAKAHSKNPPKVSYTAKARIADGQAKVRSPLRPLRQVPSSALQPSKSTSLKASAAAFTPSRPTSRPLIRAERQESVALTRASPAPLRHPLPPRPHQPTWTYPKSSPRPRSPSPSPPTSPLASPVPDEADVSDLLLAEEAEQGIINTSPTRFRDFFAHKYESFPFPVIDFPRPKAPKIFFGRGKRSQKTSPQESAPLTPAVVATPEKRKRSPEESPTPPKKLSAVRGGQYAVFSSDEQVSDSDADSSSEPGNSLNGLELCHTEDLLGLGSPEILGPIYARSWDSYTFSDEDADSDAETGVELDTGRMQPGVENGVKGSKDRIGGGEEVRTVHMGGMYLVPSSPSSSGSQYLGRRYTAPDSDTSAPPSPRASLSSRSAGPSRSVEITGAFDRLMVTPSPRATFVKQWDREYGTELEKSIMRRWIACDVPQSKLKAIKAFCDRLSGVINRQFGRTTGSQPRFVVDVFGSVAWGGQTGSSGDLDLIVRDRHMPFGFWRTPPTEGVKVSSTRHVTTNTKLDQIYDLRLVVRMLLQHRFRDVFGIYAASTPIVKFKTDAPGGGDMECDLNVNDLGGWYNSRLILAYCEISPYVLRPMIHALKLWASAQEVNDPSGQKSPPSMSSYCLTLMAIAYLQHRGVLPNLQADVEVRVPEAPADEADDVIWVGLGKEQGVKCHIGFSPSPNASWKPVNSEIRVDEALRGFFTFFSRDSATTGDGFDWKTSVVSIVNGGIIPRARALGLQGNEISREEGIRQEMIMGKGDLRIQPRNWAERRLVVQDPFIWQKNCAQAMSRAGLDRWWDAVDYTNTKLGELGNSVKLQDILVNFSPLVVRGPRQPSTPPVGRGIVGRGRGRGFLVPRGSPSGRGLWRGQ